MQNPITAWVQDLVLPYPESEEQQDMIEISQQARAESVASIQRYFQENMPERIGDLPAGILLNFFVEEIGPVIYNQAIADAQTRIQQRLSDLAGELYAPEFQYWPNVERKRRSQRK